MKSSSCVNLCPVVLCSLTTSSNNKSTTLISYSNYNSNYNSSCAKPNLKFLSLSLKTQSSFKSPNTKNDSFQSSIDTNPNPVVELESHDDLSMQIGGNPIVPSTSIKLTLADQAFYLLAFIACTTTVAFTSLVIAAVPTLHAMGRAAASLSKLADTAREELPSTMAAIRLSGLEISDLTLELSDLSQEISDGVNKSTKAVQAAEAGIRQMGTIARDQTVSMIQERASLPTISLQPVVVGAAKKTSRAVTQATKNLFNMISRSDDDNAIDRLDI